jgi:hypothetical protein
MAGCLFSFLEDWEGKECKHIKKDVEELQLKIHGFSIVVGA